MAASNGQFMRGQGDPTPTPSPQPQPVPVVDPIEMLATLLTALMSGTGSLRSRLTSRAFLLTVVAQLPGVVGIIAMLRDAIPPQYGVALAAVSGVLMAVYLAASRYENAQTAKAIAQAGAHVVGIHITTQLTSTTLRSRTDA